MTTLIVYLVFIVFNNASLLFIAWFRFLLYFVTLVVTLLYIQALYKLHNTQVCMAVRGGWSHGDLFVSAD